MNPDTKTTTLLGLLVALVIVAGLLLSLSNIAKQQRILAIGSFEDCALAGYPIMEIYPEQCRTPDGRTFVNEKQNHPVTPGESGSGIVAKKCKVGGCSAQLCGEAGDDLVSNCMFKPEYGCYQAHSSCERQVNGKCGWTPTRELTQCLAHPPALDGGVQPVY